jgi:hypothetical protein
MIRTIQEHHRAAKLLFDLAKRASLKTRGKLLQLAKGNLRLAEAQLRNPALRPDTRQRMSADQYRAIAECLSTKPEMAKRAAWFADLARTAEQYDWPSSAVAPCQVLTSEESSAIWEIYGFRQRVFAPFLTKTEQAALRAAQPGKN